MIILIFCRLLRSLGTWLGKFGGIGQRSFGYDEIYILIFGSQIHIVKQILNGIFISVHVGDNLLK